MVPLPYHNYLRKTFYSQSKDKWKFKKFKDEDMPILLVKYLNMISNIHIKY